jgi:hypothetical protein
VEFLEEEGSPLKKKTKLVPQEGPDLVEIKDDDGAIVIDE